jgi:hypothetical protein
MVTKLHGKGATSDQASSIDNSIKVSTSLVWCIVIRMTMPWAPGGRNCNPGPVFQSRDFRIEKKAGIPVFGILQSLVNGTVFDQWTMVIRVLMTTRYIDSRSPKLLN